MLQYFSGNVLELLDVLREVITKEAAGQPWQAVYLYDYSMIRDVDLEKLAKGEIVTDEQHKVWLAIEIKKEDCVLEVRMAVSRFGLEKSTEFVTIEPRIVEKRPEGSITLYRREPQA